MFFFIAGFHIFAPNYFGKYFEKDRKFCYKTSSKDVNLFYCDIAEDVILMEEKFSETTSG